MADSKDLSKRLFAAVSRGDVETIRQICDPSVVLIEAGGTYEGIDAVAEHFQAMSKPLPDCNIAVKSQVAEGDVVVSEMRFTGTQTAPMTTPQGELPPSGRAVDVPGCVVHVIREGRIVRHTGYYDQLLFLGQLGLMPEPARG